MLFSVHNVADTTYTVPRTNHGDVSNLKFEKVQNLAGSKVKAYCVINLQLGIRKTNRAPVVRNANRYVTGGLLNSIYPKQLVGGFILVNLMNHETTLGVVEQPEVL